MSSIAGSGFWSLNSVGYIFSSFLLVPTETPQSTSVLLQTTSILFSPPSYQQVLPAASRAKSEDHLNPVRYRLCSTCHRHHVPDKVAVSNQALRQFKTFSCLAWCLWYVLSYEYNSIENKNFKPGLIKSIVCDLKW